MEKKLLTFCGSSCRLKKCTAPGIHITKGFSFAASGLLKRGVIEQDPPYCMSLTEMNFVLAHANKATIPLTPKRVYELVAEYREKHFGKC